VSGEGIPDYEVLYSRERLLEIFIAYGEAGAVLYRRFLAYDLVFPLLYSTLFASLIHIGLRRTRFRLLAAAPFAMALFDYVEDGLFFSLLTLHPELPQRLVGAANVMTLGKFGCGGLSAVAGLAAGAALLRNRLRPR